MPNVLPAFTVEHNGKLLDYRIGRDVDLEAIRGHFSPRYEVKRLWRHPRHVLGFLQKGNEKLFLKVATSEGIGVITKNEANFNKQYNRVVPSDLPFRVPRFYDEGYIANKLYYHIAERFEGKLLCPHDTPERATRIVERIPQVIAFAEFIQTLPLPGVSQQQGVDETNYRQWFWQKTASWFAAIPNDVSKQYQIDNLLEIVKGGVPFLQKQSRHGDFTPWHVFALPHNVLGVIDAEHAMASSVENYDICYFIQRVYGGLKNPSVAIRIYNKLTDKGYDKKKLQTVLAARAIGGYLDALLAATLDYTYAHDFHQWVADVAT